MSLGSMCCNGLKEARLLEASGKIRINPVLEKLQHQSSAPIVQWERFLPLRTLKVVLVENDDSTHQVVIFADGTFIDGSTSELSPFLVFCQDSAKVAAELAHDFSPNIELKWGDAGLDDIILDDSIHGVAIVLAGQVQTIALNFGYPRGVVQQIGNSADDCSFLGMSDLVIYASFLEEQSFPPVLLQVESWKVSRCF